jgi:hypothetical protein
MKRRKRFWWTGATITWIQQPLSIHERSMVECLRWLVLTLVETVSVASFPVTWTSLETFEADADARQERERLEKEKKAKGISDKEARVARIYNNTTMRTFDGPFTSYAKRTWKQSLGHSGSREMEKSPIFPCKSQLT